MRSVAQFQNKINDMPLVSIVTPAYNAEQFIEDTLKSVQCQTYHNIEHIVIDDGSTDNTVDILRKYESMYNLKWFSKPNEGQAITVNKGFDMAKGQIVVWLNADDILFSKRVIDDVVETFRRKPKIDVIYGHMAIIDEQNNIIKIQYAPPKVDYNILLIGHLAACVFYRKRILYGYKLNSTLNYAIDYDQCLRMAKDGIRFGHLDKILIGWRKHSTAKSIKGHQELRKETERIKEKQDAKFGLNYYCIKTLIYLFLLTRKIYGVKKIVELYSGSKGLQLSFNPKFDSLLKLIMRQVTLYI